MRRHLKLLASVLSGVLILSLGTAPGFAQSNGSSIMGGNNASDYQPPTRNPQSDVANLNQTRGNLQNQSTVSQTSLPAVSDLQVSGVNGGAPNTNTTKTTISKDNGKGVNWWPIGIIGALTLGAMIFVVIQPDPAKRKRRATTTTSTSVDPTSEETVSAPIPKSISKPSKNKKTTPKRRSKGKKKRR